MPWIIVWQVLVFSIGALLALSAVLAAIRSFVLPRNESVLLNNAVFKALRFFFDGIARLGSTYARRDRVMALYAPVALVALPIVWLVFIALGYTAMYWALDEGSWSRCYRISNNSLLTIGADEPTRRLFASSLSYSEATLGLLLLTLLISYLPTIYQAFSRRELVVARLELRAGTPATPTSLIQWLNRSGSLSDDGPQWQRWEEWFVEIEESHTSLPVLSFFRSPQAGRSWVSAAGIILESAALISSTVDQPRDQQMELCFKAGCIAINRVARFFQNNAHATPTPLAPDADPATDPTHQEFLNAYANLQEQDLTLLRDPEKAWRHYQELHSRYAEALQYLGVLLMTPENAASEAF